MKWVERLSSWKIKYRWKTFPWYNKPRSSWLEKKKKAVLAKKWDEVKIVHFWQKWYSDYTKHKDKDRRKNFRARHKCSENKDKFSAGYWACKVLR